MAEQVAVDLDPSHSGEIKVAKLQLVGGQVWLNLATPATYTGRKLVVRDLILADNERFRSITVDASQIGARKLAINSDYAVADGNISTSVALRESHGSLDTNIRIRGVNVSLDAINKFAALPEDWLHGQMEKLDVDLAGLLSSPATWKGNIAAQINDFRQEQTAFDHGVFQVALASGVASLQSADITQDRNEFS